MKKIVYIFLLITSFVFSQELIKESDIYFKDGKGYFLTNDKEMNGLLYKEKDGLIYYTTYEKGMKIKEKILNSNRQLLSEYFFDNLGLINGNILYSDDYGVKTEANYTKGIINGFAKATYYEDIDYAGNYSFGVAHGKIKYLDINYILQEKNVSNGRFVDKEEKYLFSEYFQKEFVKTEDITIENDKAYKNKNLFTGFAFNAKDGYILSGTYYNNGERKAYFEFLKGFMSRAVDYTNKTTYTDYRYLSLGFIQGMVYTITNYVNNKENGPYYTYYEDGWRFEGTFKDGKLFGKGYYYDEKNKIREVHDYLNDKYTAIVYYDYENNIIEGRLQGEKINGQWIKTGKAIYYSRDGKLEEEVEYNGALGYQKLYYENGKIKKEAYINSATSFFSGEAKEYYETGVLKSKLNYVDGYLNGKQYYYDTTGKEIKTEEYDYGNLIVK